jgi:hypothetical protein
MNAAMKNGSRLSLFVLLVACGGSAAPDAGTSSDAGSDAAPIAMLDAASDAAAPSGDSFYAIDMDNRLVSFSSSNLAIVRTVTITGLATNERIVAIDWRAGNGSLMALSGLQAVYRIDTTTGVATLVGNPLVPMLTGTSFGFDVNPSVDRLRVVSDVGENLRLQPDTGMLVATDPMLSFEATDVHTGTAVHLTGVAYTPAAPMGTTMLYGIDSNVDALVMIVGSGNSGVFATVGALGVDASDGVGFDIVDRSGAPLAYAALSSAGASALYTINLTTGAATMIGPIGGERVHALTVVP